jgi:hypothetical protein
VWKYFSGSFAFTAIGLVLGGYAGWAASGTLSGVLSAIFVVVVLGVLEVSLSFDNAVVNATVLRDMDAVWRRRFLTWGMAIAVFGMRIVFPVLIVAVIGELTPWAAMHLALSEPERYAAILTQAHISVSAFGGSFLALVGLRHFLDHEKEVHWIEIIEKPTAILGRIEAIQIGVVLALMYAVSTQLPDADQLTFLVAGLWGILTYILVDGVGAMLEYANERATTEAAKSGLGAFLYLEVLDASFSFDGVIGAFALTTNLWIIAVCLGIGAMFVRSLTIMLVDTGTLTEYRYLEHGAFYAITALGVIMYVQAFAHIPEVVTGLIGAVLIGLSLWSSVRHNRREAGRG